MEITLYIPEFTIEGAWAPLSVIHPLEGYNTLTKLKDFNKSFLNVLAGSDKITDEELERLQNIIK